MVRFPLSAQMQKPRCGAVFFVSQQELHPITFHFIDDKIKKLTNLYEEVHTKVHTKRGRSPAPPKPLHQNPSLKSSRLSGSSSSHKPSFSTAFPKLSAIFVRRFFLSGSVSISAR